MNGNAINPIFLPNLIRTSQFIPDLTPPTLTSFTANLNNSLLILLFSETVNASSLVLPQITLLPTSANNITNLSIQLTDSIPFPEGSLAHSASDIFIQISLGSLDLNRIKQLIELFTSISNSYLSISSVAIQDMNGNYINPILQTNALQVLILYTTILPNYNCIPFITLRKLYNTVQPRLSKHLGWSQRSSKLTLCFHTTI